jgi:ligand-binding sensor domain-containing protein
VIDDSDVFSIIIDPKAPNVVYASACSGIYKSDNAGSLFHKIQGIPSTARRTRVLMQDPQHQNIVFAGTTEGLYRTTDSGATWIRTTGPELIVNDVYINPSDTNRMMLATDRGGVLVSNDGGASFRPTNSGFSSRQITSYVEDFRSPATIYVGMVNDKAWGGVFVSTNGGLNWTQKNAGLEPHDVLSLGQASDGGTAAGRQARYRPEEGGGSPKGSSKGCSDQEEARAEAL